MSLTRKFAVTAASAGLVLGGLLGASPATAAAGANGVCSDMGPHVTGNAMVYQEAELRSYISTSDSFGCWIVRRVNDGHFDVQIKITKHRSTGNIVTNPTYQNVLSVAGWPSTDLGAVDIEVWVYRVGQLGGNDYIGWAKVTIPRG